jgi:hypothetical protein
MQGLSLKEIQGLLQPGGNPAAMQAAYQKIAKKVEEIGKDTGAKLLDLLTAEQRGRWKELTGKPFPKPKP